MHKATDATASYTSSVTFRATFLAAARSRSGSNNRSGCYSLPSRRFATSRRRLSAPELGAEGARLALLACVSSTNRNSFLSVEFRGVTKLTVRRAEHRRRNDVRKAPKRGLFGWTILVREVSPRPRATTNRVGQGAPALGAEGARLALLACVSSTNRNSSLSVEFWGVTKLSVRRSHKRGATQ